MLTLPLSLFLIPYGLLLVIALGIGVVCAYHLVRYGATTGISFLATFAFFAGAALLLSLTWNLLRDIDWSTLVTIGPSSAPVEQSLF